jgi:ABC-type Fe3+/spermidine/putrescine transport system ATPase subunit
VALARAIVTRPDILLFDEPLSNLDAKLREKVRVEIRELQRRLRITSIYVTHDQAEALVVSDRIVVMNRGRIEQIGDPDTIYRAPDNAFVADFIGLTNIVEGTLLDDRTVDTPVGRLRIDVQPPTSARVKLIWRPEDMKATANDGANRLVGTVRQVIFRGNVTEFTFDVNGHSLRGQVDNDLRPQEGNTITLGLDADRIRVVA